MYITVWVFYLIDVIVKVVAGLLYNLNTVHTVRRDEYSGVVVVVDGPTKRRRRGERENRIFRHFCSTQHTNRTLSTGVAVTTIRRGRQRPKKKESYIAPLLSCHE
jgi:hypothetical protein